jgi:2-oxoglutarate dehydrogenase E1 component
MNNPNIGTGPDSESLWFFEQETHPQTKSRLFSPLLNPVAPQSAVEFAPQTNSSSSEELICAAFRALGHRIATINPLFAPRSLPELMPAAFGLQNEAEDSVAGRCYRRMRELYTQNIGLEYLHIQNEQARLFIQEAWEKNTYTYNTQQRLDILKHLTFAETFETFLHRRFLGAKRFSLEGLESLIPALHHLLAQSTQAGVSQWVFGMAHRGRLNTLVNFLNKPARAVMGEFADIDDIHRPGKGDVKYHMGYSHTFHENLTVDLCYNPSHLEFVNPVVVGSVRAYQDMLADKNRTKVLGLMIHGDASFVGQGVVTETLNLAQLSGYETGGTLHLILNNQIGFTTLPEEGSSGYYNSDWARAFDIPIFHVNGDDPEAVLTAVDLAFQYRQKFGLDALVDIIGYRKWGHNEGDEPSFTQPKLDRLIKQHTNVRALYAKRTQQEDTANRLLQEANQHWEEELAAMEPPKLGDFSTQTWRLNDVPQVHEKDWVPLQVAQSQWPEDLKPHTKITKLYDQRLEMAKGVRPYDWGGAEMMAYATLLSEGISVRLSGQDARRGTFSHRHAAIFDQNNQAAFIPLAHLAKHLKESHAFQSHIEVINSPLSETAVMGFDYGYTLPTTQSLVIWEAQFGDFANGAQVIIDQFLVSAEQKWHQNSNLVLLLPHGYEGQGPEHSSARIERFLASTANHNMIIAQPTTPAQIFHLLRRHAHQSIRRPMVVFTPKSLLRHPEAISQREELLSGQFSEVMITPQKTPLSQAQKVILCSGKVYYEAAAQIREEGLSHVVLVRLEQLYPFPSNLLLELLTDFPRGRELIWLQDEPFNMGAWPNILLHHGETLNEKYRLSCVARPASSSPATGSLSRHQHEQRQLLKQALI